MTLFSDRGCPFAHRVLALAEHIDLQLLLHEGRVGEPPEGLARYSPSERVPLLVHEGLVLTESRVMLEHIAEHEGYAGAYPEGLRARSLHRHAMAIGDDYLPPLLFGRRTTSADDPRLQDALDWLEAATRVAPVGPSLLALHLAPLWLRFGWWQPNHALASAVRARGALHDWLEAAAELPCVTRTLPDLASRESDLERARAAGLLELPAH